MQKRFLRESGAFEMPTQGQPSAISLFQKGNADSRETKGTLAQHGWPFVIELHCASREENGSGWLGRLHCLCFGGVMWYGKKSQCPRSSTIGENKLARF